MDGKFGVHRFNHEKNVTFHYGPLIIIIMMMIISIYYIQNSLQYIHIRPQKINLSMHLQRYYNCLINSYQCYTHDVRNVQYQLERWILCITNQLNGVWSVWILVRTMISMIKSMPVGVQTCENESTFTSLLPFYPSIFSILLYQFSLYSTSSLVVV